MTMCVVLRSINCDTVAHLTTRVEHDVLSMVGTLLKRVDATNRRLITCTQLVSYYVILKHISAKA